MIRFRPHAVGALMTDPVSMDMSLLTEIEQAIYRKKNRTDEEKAMVEEFWLRGLSKGAKTAITQFAKEHIYQYDKKVSSKEMDKGIACEKDSLDLYNRVHFSRYVKHEGRVSNDILTGECDIYVPRVRTIDLKTSWSLDTFPVLSSDCHDPMYEWQGRAYMLLYDTLEHEVAFCLVSTPDDIIPRWEQVDLHKVDHIDPAMRVTKIVYKRDVALENRLIRKCQQGQKFMAEVVGMILNDHDATPPAGNDREAPVPAADWRAEFMKTA